MFSFGLITKALWESRELIITVLVVIGVSWGLWKFYKTVQANAQAQVKIEVLENNVKDLQRLNEQLEMQRKLDQRITESHLQDIKELEDQVQDLTLNLGQGAEDLAAESIREYFRRLKGIQ